MKTAKHIILEAKENDKHGFLAVLAQCNTISQGVGQDPATHNKGSGGTSKQSNTAKEHKT